MNVFDEHTMRFDQIRESEIFIIIWTPTAALDPWLIQQVIWAKLLGKPFWILLKKGCELPEGFLSGVVEFSISEWEDMDQLHAMTMEIDKNFTVKNRDEYVTKEGEEK